MIHARAPISALVVCGALSLSACASAPDGPPAAAGLALPPAADTAAEAIDEDVLAAIVDALADDAFGGRGPSTEGDVKTRRYIIDYLSQLGFEPGGPDGRWEQEIDIVGVTSHMPEKWIFVGSKGIVEVERWDDYIGVSGVQRETASIDAAEVVFVGYGIEAPEESWDDFKGVDLEGKVLLMLNNDPDWDPGLFAGQRRLYYGRWTYKYESAARRGAVAAIIIHTTPSAGYPFQVVQSSWSGVQFQLPAGDEPRLQLEAWLTLDAARRLTDRAGHDLDALIASARSRDFEPVPLGLKTSIRFTNTVDRESRTANVLGLLPGRDPKLREQVVVYTAHHDHLGTGEPDDEGDTVYNGARDNASGVATILGAARAFAALPRRPRRSILIMPVGAEEQGLLGSRFYAENPTVAPGLIAANINVDSANIFGPAKDVAVIGRGKSDLERLLQLAAARQDRIVVDEPFPDKGYYYRSDQFNFAKIGVPALYFKAGTDFRGRPAEWGRQREDAWRAERYHQPSDEVYGDWDFSGMVEDARLAFWVGLAVADSDVLPTWTPGDEFEGIRRQALIEAGLN